MSGHDGGFERRRDPDSPLLYSVSKTVSFSAKIIAHRTNLGSMANPLLPKNPSPIMLAIVAFRFGFFFFPSPHHVWLRAATRITSAAEILSKGFQPPSH